MEFYHENLITTESCASMESIEFSIQHGDVDKSTIEDDHCLGSSSTSSSLTVFFLLRENFHVENKGRQVKDEMVR